MATVATEPVPTTGLAATANAATGGAGGDKVRPDSIVRVINASGGSINATMVTPQTVDGDLAVADRIVAVPAGAARYIRATATYRNPADGLVNITWSASASVTFEVIS
jgi:zona occludens toxin (predicted ATPase)